MKKLSIQQAQKLVLLSQGLPPTRQPGSAIDATLSAINKLGYVQIDTISVVQRAHHHTLWNRNPRYELAHLDQLVAEKKVFEYWSHAAAYLPMRDYRYSLPRKQALATGVQNHWFERDEKLMKYVRDRIESEGPLMAKDFDNRGKKAGEWETKPTKRALETLFMQGDLMIPSRNQFHKVYDLTERVLPDDLDITIPTPQEHARFLITRFLKANGLGQANEISYLLKSTRSTVANTLQEMLLSKELIQLTVNNSIYFALPASLELLNKPLARRKLKILSPFDNLLIQRKRMQALFGFDYQLECYVPASKRKHGFFSLPILWDGRLVGRMDCKAVRKQSRLNILHLEMEKSLTRVDDFANALASELPSFLKFNACDHLHLAKVSPELGAYTLMKIFRLKSQ
ncbi:MAG: winged helix-turn-helix domain-containing protein [Puniceicoccaceae bacterium]